jgi:hypothetical protein
VLHRGRIAVKGRKTEWDRVARFGKMLEQKVRDHPDETEVTAKLAEVLAQSGIGVVGDQTGACHFSDGSCQEITELQCIAAKGIAWDGPGTHCPVSSSETSAQKVSKTA